MDKLPRILVVSHTVFSGTGNMGKTMMDMLSCVPSDHLAQLFFHSEVPTQRVCERYFRVTDKDMLYTVAAGKRRFRVFGKDDIQTNRKSSRTDTGLSARIYQFSRRRTPLIYLMRNSLWTLGKWDSPELDAWIREFQPDLIFFAAGDYAFAYKIVCRLSDRYNLPVVMWCSDDHYIGRKKTMSVLYRHVCRNRLKWARRTAARSGHMITISDKMQRDYAALFGIPTTTLRISAQENPFRMPPSERTGIVYTGNLGVNRVVPLVEIGRALKEAGIDGYDRIDVYSGDQNRTTLEQLTDANGIRFHGSVGREEVAKVLGAAKFVLHVEAFDEKSRVRTRYSLSTKVAEYLSSGACVLVYGPEDISSVEYLHEQGAAMILGSAEEAPGTILKLLRDPGPLVAVQQKACQTVEQCHSRQENDRMILSILSGVGRKGRCADEA